MAQTVKHLPTVQETQVQSLGWEDLLEKEWQPTPVFLPGKSHTRRSLVGYSPWGHRVRHNWVTSLSLSLSKLEVWSQMEDYLPWDTIIHLNQNWVSGKDLGCSEEQRWKEEMYVAQKLLAGSQWASGLSVNLNISKYQYHFFSLQTNSTLFLSLCSETVIYFSVLWLIFLYVCKIEIHTKENFYYVFLLLYRIIYVCLYQFDYITVFLLSHMLFEGLGTLFFFWF